MRKLSFLMVLLLIFGGVFSASAQDEPGTIAEIVVSSTEAETPEFTVLLAALQAADPAFIETVSAPDAGVTVFAPTDAAFTALLEELGLTAEELLGNTDLLNDVLAYHVVPANLTSSYFTSIFESSTMSEPFATGTLLADALLTYGPPMDDMSLMTVNESNVVQEVGASNGNILVIDAVLVPEMGEEEETMEEDTSEDMSEDMSEDEMASNTIADVVVNSASGETPEFTVLLAAVQSANPAILEALTNGGPYTVFAPTDAAFTALLEELGLTAEELLAQTDLLNNVLQYHVVPGIISAETVVAAAGEGAYVGTLIPVALDVQAGEGVTVNGVNVIQTDISADNGIIHVIDGVLVPQPASAEG